MTNAAISKLPSLPSNNQEINKIGKNKAGYCWYPTKFSTVYDFCKLVIILMARENPSNLLASVNNRNKLLIAVVNLQVQFYAIFASNALLWASGQLMRA